MTALSWLLSQVISPVSLHRLLAHIQHCSCGHKASGYFEQAADQATYK